MDAVGKGEMTLPIRFCQCRLPILPSHSLQKYENWICNLSVDGTNSFVYKVFDNVMFSFMF